MSAPLTIATLCPIAIKVRRFSAKFEREQAAWRASKTPEQLAVLRAEWEA